MANIVGNSFKPWVIDQIETRQNVLAQQFRLDDSFVKYVSKTPWLRMASSVDITTTGSFQVTGNNLAKDHVLFGGTVGVGRQTDESGEPFYTNLGLKYGVTTDGSLVNQGSYGFGGTEWGIRPMPGLNSVKIDTYNNGAIRKAVVSFTCFNKDQFTILEALYMRVGYYVLVEWGHTTYLDSTTTPYTLETRKDFNTKAFTSFFEGKKTSQILKEIDDEVQASTGNYDGFLGRVTNFNWSFNNGVYNCSITAYSPGDVIESLKSNKTFSTKNIDVLPTGSNTPLEEGETPPPEPALFIQYRNSSELGSSLYKWSIKLDKNGTNTAKTSGETQADVEFYRWTDGNGGKEYFVTLGRLLKIIEGKLLLYDDDKSPIINIDSDYDTNFCARFPEQVSTDYGVCYVPFKISNKTNTESWTSTGLNKALGKDKTYAYKNYVGKIMHILVNFDFVVKTINENIDDKNRLNLKDFIQSILSGIQQSLGGINDFNVGYDYITNTIKIYDNSPLVSEQLVNSKKPTVARFKSYGVEANNKGSFLLNISLESSLSKDMATMIAVGSQDNGNQVGENATAFSLYNRGLKDRINPSKLDAYITNQTNKEATDQNEVYLNNRQILYDLIKQRGSKGSSDIDLRAAYGVNTEFANYYLGLATKQEDTPGNFFIPFNLTLEMDGLSGMRIYDVFSITNEILPEQYNETLQFVVKGINHTIDRGGWTTTLDSLTYNQFGATDPNPILKITGNPGKSYSGGGGSSPTPSGPTSYAPIKEPAPLRLEVKRLKEVTYNNGSGKLNATLGELSYVNDNGGREKLGYVMELPWRNNKNAVSCIPPNPNGYGCRKIGNHHKYGNCFHVTPDPPGRSEVMIHRGVNETWTKGCILPVPEFETIDTAQMAQAGTVLQEKTGTTYTAKKEASAAFVNQIYAKIPEGYFKIAIIGVPEADMNTYSKSYTDTSKNWTPAPTLKP